MSLIGGFAAFITLIISNYLSDFTNSDELIVLRNNHIEVGIMTEAGGRIVILRKPGFENILKTFDELMEDPEKNIPEISPYNDFIEFGGHITWVGPQNEWWSHQKLNEDRYLKKADWPPDPYLIYGKNKIISQNDTSITLVGLESPISGVQITKYISIGSEGTVTIKSTAKNISKENVSWDLWMLTRLDGFAKVYVPIDDNGLLELKKNDTKKIQATPYNTLNGYFTFKSSLPESSKIEQVQEVHLNPSANFLAGIDQKQILIIQFEMLEKELIHPDHGQVELYSYINDSGTSRLLELEVHGAYRNLAPGAKMSLQETWHVFPFNSEETSEEQFGFLDKFK